MRNSLKDILIAVCLSALWITPTLIIVGMLITMQWNQPSEEFKAEIKTRMVKFESTVNDNISILNGKITDHIELPHVLGKRKNDY